MENFQEQAMSTVASVEVANNNSQDEETKEEETFPIEDDESYEPASPDKVQTPQKEETKQEEVV